MAAPEERLATHQSSEDNLSEAHGAHLGEPLLPSSLLTFLSPFWMLQPSQCVYHWSAAATPIHSIHLAHPEVSRLSMTITGADASVDE
jgi:hypothetical protein